MYLIGSLRIGGAETLITEYALNINKENFEVIIVTLDGKNNTNNERKLEDQSVRVIYLGDMVLFPNPTNVFKKLINKIHRFILMKKISEKENFSVIHTYLDVNEYILPLRLKRKKIKLYHSVLSEVEVSFGKNKFTKRLLMRYFIKYKGMIPIALHSRMKEELNLLFNVNNCKLIPNTINLKKFQKKYNKQEIFDALNINEKTFIIGHVGRFAEVKNHDFLMKLFEFIIIKHPNTHLLLIGTGKLENQIKERVYSNGLNKNVSFLGNRSDIPELMSIMDVFIFPSFYEGFPTALLEAQATGIKCVVSNTISNETYLTDLVVALSLNDLLDTWYKAIFNTEKVNKVKNELEKYDISNVIKTIENLYVK